MESVTVTFTGYEPVVVGVPEIVPFDASIAKFAGSPVADHVYGVTPPAAVACVV